MSSMWNKLVVFGLAAALSTAVLANEGGRGGIGREGIQSSENVPTVVSNEAQASAEKTEYATSNSDAKKDKKSHKRKGNHHRGKKSADAAKTDGATTDASTSASNGTTSDAGAAGMTPASKY